MHLYRNAPDAGERVNVITTVEDLGRYLQELREKRRVTQASLSAKTVTIAGHKISRSRISEIENARRDRVSERELRVYMVGLKCTPRHIDRMMKALRECTGSLSKEFPAGPASTRSATPDPYPAGLGDAEDDLALREEKSDDDPTAGSENEEEGCERWSQAAAMCIDSRDASQPQPSHGHWQRDRIVLAAAMALVIVVFTGLGVEFLLRRESVDLPMPPGIPTVLLVPPNAPPVSGNTSGFLKDVTFPDREPVRVDDKLPTKTSKVRGRPGVGDSTSRDTTQRVVRRCCVGKAQRQAVPPVVLSRVRQDWHSYAGSGGGRQPDPVVNSW